jgi:uncharacterized protein (TIGR02453 family)
MNTSNILSFLNKLKNNNSKEWMDANRAHYQEASADFQVFINVIIGQISKFDTSIAHLEAKQCMFRINRDTRFSKNKAPYKTNFGAYICCKGKKGGAAGYYVHIEPGNSFIAAGIWMPEPPLLAQIRQEIDYQHADFNKIMKKKTFRNYFPAGLDNSDKLIRPPKGYDAENPAIDIIKLKNFVVISQFKDDDTAKNNFTSMIGKAFSSAYPMIHFLNAAEG